MLPAFGPVRQLGFMTRDLEASIDLFVTQLGIGPWLTLPSGPLADTRYRGVPCTPNLSVAFAYRDGLEYELMQLNDDTPSMWRDLLDLPFERERLHHWCIWPTDYDAALREAIALGYAEVQEGATGRGRFVYLRQPGTDLWLEITEATPGRKALQALVVEGAQGWDGATRTFTLPR